MGTTKFLSEDDSSCLSKRHDKKKYYLLLMQFIKMYVTSECKALLKNNNSAKLQDILFKNYVKIVKQYCVLWIGVDIFSRF